jgi:hypothetical protein
MLDPQHYPNVIELRLNDQQLTLMRKLFGWMGPDDQIAHHLVAQAIRERVDFSAVLAPKPKRRNRGR